jgi:hypothetical protein
MALQGREKECFQSAGVKAAKLSGDTFKMP